MPIGYQQPNSAEEWEEARHLVEDYTSSLNLDLSFQNIAHELTHLEDEYGPPAGAFLLAREGNASLGCVGVRYFSDGVGEIKRLYVIPSARGRGVGRRLAEGIVDAAGRLGYTRLLLDTLPTMKDAQGLYQSLGFMPVEPYRFNPVPGTAFLQLDLR
jgi:GNAT superfamily N-acetyltransferase